MDYEDDYDLKPFNFQLLAIIGICCLVVGVFAYPFILKSLEPKPVPIQEPKNESKLIQIEYVTVLVTPTPDGQTYYATEYENGIRKINNPFSFYRKDASGKKELKLMSIVYDYKITNSLHWHNPSDNIDYEQKPSKNKKYLWVFYGMWLDDRVSDDTRFYRPSTKNFVVINRKTEQSYNPIDYPKHLRISELEYSYDITGTIQSEYFGTKRLYSSSTEYANTAGEYSDEQQWIQGGKSNAQSGYVLYEIEESDDVKDLIAGINFYSWGDAFWRLSP